MADREYKHKSIQHLFNLWMEHSKEMGKGMGILSMMWKALSPNIPDWLDMLDNDEEMLGKIKGFLGTIMEAMEEDAS